MRRAGAILSICVLLIAGCSHPTGQGNTAQPVSRNVVNCAGIFIGSETPLGKEIIGLKKPVRCGRIVDANGNLGTDFRIHGVLDPVTARSQNTGKAPDFATQISVTVIRMDDAKGALHPFEIAESGFDEINPVNLHKSIPVLLGGQPADAKVFSLLEAETKISHSCMVADGRNTEGISVGVMICRAFKKNASSAEILAVARDQISADFERIGL